MPIAIYISNKNICADCYSCFLQLYAMSDELIVKSKNNEGDHSIFSNLDCNCQLHQRCAGLRPVIIHTLSYTVISGRPRTKMSMWIIWVCPKFWSGLEMRPAADQVGSEFNGIACSLHTCSFTERSCSRLINWEVGNMPRQHSRWANHTITRKPSLIKNIRLLLYRQTDRHTHTNQLSYALSACTPRHN